MFAIVAHKGEIHEINSQQNLAVYVEQLTFVLNNKFYPVLQMKFYEILCTEFWFCRILFQPHYSYV